MRVVLFPRPSAFPHQRPLFHENVTRARGSPSESGLETATDREGDFCFGNGHFAISYEKYGLFIRASANYRSPFIEDGGLGASVATDTWVDDHLQIDVSTNHRLSKRLTVYAECLNVNEEPYIMHWTEHDNLLRKAEYYGYGANVGIGFKLQRQFAMNIPRLLLALAAIATASLQAQPAPGRPPPLQPRVITEPTRHDTDDPAIWLHPTDRGQSLVLGTDKDTDGALYIYDLEGKIVNRVGGLKRPNNVDVGYGLQLGGRSIDIAVLTEREQQRLRVFRVPDMVCVDRGDLVVFEGDTSRAPMGIALYKRPRDGAFFVFVGGKSGPREGYLAQYRLTEGGEGFVRLTLVRQFGRYSGRKEIEAIAVDAELGFVYYSDETFGVRKYSADPDVPNPNQELAAFGTTGYASDHEGISIYKTSDRRGYILVSDQQANQFRIYAREGSPNRPHEHPLLKTVPVAAIESDGSDVTSEPLGPKFPHGLFVAMSNGKVFHYYSWDDIAGQELRRVEGR